MYPPDLVAPMSKDLTDHGFKGLTTSDEVKEVFENDKGTFLL